MQHYLLFFLVMAERISGIAPVAISACSGESVKLFSIVPFIRTHSVFFLYVNDSNYTLIGMWSKGKNKTVVENISLDEYGNLWIHNITQSDENKYKVLQSINGTSSPDLWEAQLTVLVAPANSCRPQVTRDGNTLIASLPVGTDCGKPEAVPYLLKYPDITYISQTKATLTPGREAGTYYACIETPALSCARRYNISDLCSSTTVYESNCQKTLTDSIFILASAFLGLVGLFTTVVIFWFLHRKRWGRPTPQPPESCNHVLKSEEETDPMTNDDISD